MPTTVEETEKAKIGEDKKDELLLDSLEIKGYRCFEHLTIEKLGRVNLIVGKNNVGKTALLETLWIYSEACNLDRLMDLLNLILERRLEKEVPTNKTLNNLFSIATIDRNVEERTNRNVGLHFRHLFYNRPTFQNTKSGICSFLICSGKELAFDTDNGIQPMDCVEVECVFNDQTCLIRSGSKYFHDKIKNLFVNSSGLNLGILTEIWDEIILQNEEDEVITALKIISGKVEDLNFINYPKGCKQRVPVVRIKGLSERVPLSSLGEGMSRLLSISLALVNCRNGILLIDEIENGLHYSVLPDVWKLIFKTAKDLNVQVFATTHSKDCIEAFAQAAVDSPEDGMLIRLERHAEKIVAKTINEEMLADAVNYDVEVR